MINKARLLAALDLQPEDKGFPSVALLHAICAYASVLVSAETLGEGMGRKYWEGEKSPRAYHYKCVPFYHRFGAGADERGQVRTN